MVLVMNNNVFRIVYEAVVYGKRVSLSRGTLVRCIEVASKNKVLLHFLRALDVRVDARLREEARYRRFLEHLRIVVSALEGLDYVFIKLRKPVVYVPADIDVLVDRGQVSEAVHRLMRWGFRVEVLEPYCVTMVHGDAVVDLYVYPTLGGMIYLDAGKLLEHRVFAEFNGIVIPVLETYVEALLSIAHALYKERIYTLNDYVTVKSWFSRKTIRLAEELQCLNAVEEAFIIHRLVEEHSLALPYRIPLTGWIRLLGSKISCDELARSTLPNLFRALRDRRFGKLVVSKITRETY